MAAPKPAPGSVSRGNVLLCAVLSSSSAAFGNISMLAHRDCLKLGLWVSAKLRGAGTKAGLSQEKSCVLLQACSLLMAGVRQGDFCSAFVLVPIVRSEMKAFSSASFSLQPLRVFIFNLSLRRGLEFWRGCAKFAH